MNNTKVPFLKRLIGEKSGNAMLLVALGLPMLVGGTGLAVDTAQWYMWKRELQHSVDQAALAGAWALAHDSATDTYTLRAEQEYGVNLNVVADYASEPDVKLANFQGGVDNSVIVTASVTHMLPFTSLLLGKPTVINVRAQAAFEAGSIHKACLMTLKKNDTTFLIGNGATVEANCGLMAISCDPDKPGIAIGDNADIAVNKITVCREADIPPDYDGEVVIDPSLASYNNDFHAPEKPEDEPTKTYACNKQKKGVQTAAPVPGYYPDGIKVSCDTEFDPGIYYVGTELDLSHNAFVTGYGVMFVLVDGAGLKLGGSGANDNTNGSDNQTNIKSGLNLSPPQASVLEALGYDSDFANKYENVLIISEETDAEIAHVINGNANTHIQGKIHLPKGNVKINGAAEAADGVCFQISAYTLEILGGAYLKTLCDEDATNEISVTSGVRLVA